MAKKADLIITLGGDGTFLRAVRLLGGGETPVLGINLGKFGFLAEVEVAEMYDILPEVLEGGFQLERRMMLDCEVYLNEKKIVARRALNEIVLNRSAKDKLMHVDVHINDIFFNGYSADGIIFATPTGSTAYSLSAGGPIINPKEKIIAMTPVCSHSFFNRSVILNKSDEIKLRCLEENEPNTTLNVDGLTFHSGSFDLVKIKTSKQFVNLLKAGKRSFYTTLKGKLNTWTTGDWHGTN